MMLHEIQNGAGTFTFDPGWFKTAPSNADMRKWVESRYANVPLQKWWKHLAIDAADKGGSYSWNVAGRAHPRRLDLRVPDALQRQPTRTSR